MERTVKRQIVRGRNLVDTNYRETKCKGTNCKGAVYKAPIENLDDSKARIINEIELIENETFHDVFSETVKRLNLCIDVKGNTFEQHL